MIFSMPGSPCRSLVRALSSCAQPMLMLLPPETAHKLTLQALKNLPLPAAKADDPRLKVEAFGLTFPNPAGMAGGFDKTDEVPSKLLRLGFGFVEAGCVTPRPQIGNPRPRVFRLQRDGALINRLGFNNEGLAAVKARLAHLQNEEGIIGVNLGANKDSADRAADYVLLIESLSGLADFVTVNISSPNTPGLRDLQGKEALDGLLARICNTKRRGRKLTRLPVLVKIAPDLALPELDDICMLCLKHSIDGMIVS